MVPSADEVILVFDGDCGFCTSSANFVVAHSSVPVVAVAWQLTDLSSLDLDVERASQRVYLVEGDTTNGGHRAFARLLIVQRSPVLRCLGWMMQVPPLSWAAAVGYRLVARFRHRLPGGTPACALGRNTSAR